MTSIALLIEGFPDKSAAKTAISLIRYRSADVVALIDSTRAGLHANEVLGVGGNVPIYASLDDTPVADTLMLGTAPSGGRLPANWRTCICAALRRGMTVISGLHDRLADDPEFSQLAQQHQAEIHDIRHSKCTHLATRKGLRPECLRIHAVGHDCNVGKMVAMLEIEAVLKQRQRDAQFVATGQTGIMITGSGIAVDCVVADFVNGAAEQLVLDHQEHEILLIEGQGSILSPMYSAVTCGLLHGCVPHGLILCYQVGRTKFRHTHTPIPPLRVFYDLYESITSSLSPCKIIGIAVNGRDCSTQEGAAICSALTHEFQVPAVDVYRDGAEKLADAVEQLENEYFSMDKNVC